MTDHSGRPPMALLLVACALATTLALLRPAFQVSDEVAYFASVQPIDRVASASRACQPLTTRVMTMPPARRIFRALVSPALFHACEASGTPAAALLITRAVLGLGLAVMVWATWVSARLLAPSTPEVAWLGSTMVAVHPVLATMSSAIAPDAIANPLAALGCMGLIGAASLEGTKRYGWLAGGLAATMLAVLAKDTAIGLALLTLVGSPWLVMRGGSGTSARRARLRVLQMWLGVLLVAAAIVYFDGGPLRRFQQAASTGGALDRVLSFAVVWRAIQSIPAYFWTFVGNLGNFGGTRVLLPQVFGWLVLAGAVTGAAGLWRHPGARRRVADERSYRALTWLFGAATLVYLVQAPVRDAMLGAAPAVQGRWLFPLMLPFALWSSLGILSWTNAPARVLPVLVSLAASIPMAALFWVLVPRYYLSFPTTYDLRSLFLRGPSGVPIEPALLVPFIAPPRWLGSSWVPWLLLIGAAASLSWLVLATLRRAMPPAAPDR